MNECVFIYIYIYVNLCIKITPYMCAYIYICFLNQPENTRLHQKSFIFKFVIQLVQKFLRHVFVRKNNSKRSLGAITPDRCKNSEVLQTHADSISFRWSCFFGKTPTNRSLHTITSKVLVLSIYIYIHRNVYIIYMYVTKKVFINI